MKTKVLKFVMPVFAFILAMVLAFATGTKDNSRIGYYPDPVTGEPQEINVDCDSSTDKLCKFEGIQVYAEPEFDTELKKSSSQ